MSDSVQVRNLSRSDAPVVVDGSLWCVKGYELRAVPEEVAHALAKKYPTTITLDSEVLVPDIPGQPTMYLANMSGSPHLPSKLQAQIYNTKVARFETVDIDNPLKQPMTIRETFSPGQKSYEIPGQTGQEWRAETLPPITLAIPPYTRVAVPKIVAERAIDRDAMHPDGYRGWIILSRPPSDNEPTPAWGLDELRLYAELVDPEGCGDKALGTQPERTYAKNEDKVAAKRLLWQALFFRLVDPDYTLPSANELKQIREARKAK